MRRNHLALTQTICTGLLCCALPASAQRPAEKAPTSRDSIKNATVSVYQTYQPELKPVYKPLLVPSVPEPDTTTFAQRYNVAPEAAALPYYPIPIRPLALQRDSAADSRQDYLSAGGGNRSTFMLDGATARIRGENLSSVLSLHHIQQADERINGRRYNETEAAWSMKTLMGFGILNGQVDGLHKSYGDYGFNESRTPPTDLGMRTYSGFGVAAGLDIPVSSKVNGVRSIRPELAFRYFNGPAIGGETMFRAEVPLVAEPGNGVRIEVTPSVNFTTVSLPTGTGYNNVHTLASALVFDQPRFLLRAGVIPAYVQDQGGRVLPDLAFLYRIIPEKTSLEIGWKGRIIQNRYEELAAQNPYLNRYRIAQTESREAYAEVATNVGQNIALSVRGSYWEWSALPLFINDYTPPAATGFNLQYEAAKAMMLQARLRYAIGENLQVGAFTQLANYFPEISAQLWHTPNVRFGADAHFEPVKTLQISGLFSFADGIRALGATGQSISLNPIGDLSARIAYQFIPQWTIWVQGTNLMDLRNERYYGYPAIGRGVAAGLRVNL